jgi:hypothetical protein
MCRYSHFIVIVLCLCGHFADAQLDKNYSPAPFQDTIPSDIFNNLKFKLERDKSRVAADKANVREYIKGLYSQRSDLVIETFNEGLFILDEEITPYLQKILKHIYQSNPALNQETNVYAYRSEVPNAMSFGEGTIGFTLGLLSLLETDDQIAFVLCHELAHYHAGHSDQKAFEIAQFNYDDEVKKKVKAITRSDYGRFSKYKELITDLGLSMNRHSRDKEFEADSIALLLYLNTSFNKNEPLTTLALLDSSDVPLYRNNIDFNKYFDFSLYPFKDHWLTYEPSDVWYASSEMHDSTATHPECKKRIAAIQRQLMQREGRVNENLQPPKINLMRERSRFEIVESGYHFNGYGRTLFNALILAERHPENVYVHAMIAKCLFHLYAYQKNHTLSQVLDLPDPRFEENYNRFVTFIHTLRLMELASISYYYTDARKDLFESDEEFLYAVWLTSKTEISKQSPDAVRERYLAKFPKGKYASMMQ